MGFFFILVKYYLSFCFNGLQRETRYADNASYPDIQAARSTEQLIALNDSSMKAMSELHPTSGEGTSFSRFGMMN